MAESLRQHQGTTARSAVKVFRENNEICKSLGGSAPSPRASNQLENFLAHRKLARYPERAKKFHLCQESEAETSCWTFNQIKSFLSLGLVRWFFYLILTLFFHCGLTWLVYNNILHGSDSKGKERENKKLMKTKMWGPSSGEVSSVPYMCWLLSRSSGICGAVRVAQKVGWVDLMNRER